MRTADISRQGLVLAATALVLAATLPTAAEAAASTPPSGHYTGSLSDGATWIADVPEQWNGTVLLYSHGFGHLEPRDAPNGSNQALLDAGYALVGSSYNPNGPLWALNDAERDQFATLTAFRSTIGRAERVISVGQSMGGLINSQIARDGAGRIDGSLNVCGLVGGGIDVANYQLDGQYTIATLLDPDHDHHLAGFTSLTQPAQVAAQLTDVVTAAQKTPEGRARLTLAAAYLNLPGWPDDKTPSGTPGTAPTDYLPSLLSFFTGARYSIEQSAGGNVSWNAGVDYTALLKKSAHADEVRKTYRAAGLDLHKDLATLTRNAHITADPQALAHARRTSTTGQGLAVPLLDIHNNVDEIVPAEHETAFRTRIKAAGDSALLRQAYVDRAGHCNFTPAEIVAGVNTVNERVTTGRWGATATTAALQASAEALHLDGGAAFVDDKPGQLVGVREGITR
ncbi:alpha/beta hydrolase [Streptomyces coacervatus]|uniref:Alpha/beta hydrolase n=1 Tax=Streptomyces coacervatus TaxID=647381 RepID=A0ABP7JBW5_9ACTN|nr:alpha/beta hydrolase [Streptomyces coacervatus]MDF2271893.1 alpha/beta hydrolase [Streptomyces coacervatus]